LSIRIAILVKKGTKLLKGWTKCKNGEEFDSSSTHHFCIKGAEGGVCLCCFPFVNDMDPEVEGTLEWNAIIGPIFLSTPLDDLPQHWHWRRAGTSPPRLLFVCLSSVPHHKKFLYIWRKHGFDEEKKSEKQKHIKIIASGRNLILTNGTNVFGGQWNENSKNILLFNLIRNLIWKGIMEFGGFTFLANTQN
jgi:hypothetical protein